MRSLICTSMAVFMLLNTASFEAAAAEDTDHQFAVYVSDEEERFKCYGWGFLDEFKNTWELAQYYWGQCRFLGKDHLSYADSVDLAYVAGHGSPSYIVMSEGQKCHLDKMAWGSYSTPDRKGDMEYIVFQSCSVLKMDDGWRERWRHYSSNKNEPRPFSGLHIAMGFHTNHANRMGCYGSGHDIADEFAENLEDGDSVRRSWYKAARDERPFWLPDKNKPAVFYIRPHKKEKITGHNSTDYKYGDSNYLLDAYYMK